VMVHRHGHCHSAMSPAIPSSTSVIVRFALHGVSLFPSAVEFTSSSQRVAFVAPPEGANMESMNALISSQCCATSGAQPTAMPARMTTHKILRIKQRALIVNAASTPGTRASKRRAALGGARAVRLTCAASCSSRASGSLWRAPSCGRCSLARAAPPTGPRAPPGSRASRAGAGLTRRRCPSRRRPASSR
jgi:hypothetical protein